MATLMQWNCRGVTTSVLDIRHLILRYRPLVFLLNETFLSSISSLPVFTPYHWVRVDRDARRPSGLHRNRGGVAALVHDSLHITRVSRFRYVGHGHVPSEWLSLTVSPRTTDTCAPSVFRIITGYRSQLATRHFPWVLQQFADADEMPCFFAGDLNCDPTCDDADGVALRDAVTAHNLLALDSAPTRNDRLLDVWITNSAASACVRQLAVHVGDQLSSDHQVTSVSFRRCLAPEAPVSAPEEAAPSSYIPSPPQWHYRDANWRVFRESLGAALSSVTTPSAGAPLAALDDYAEAITAAILTAARAAIPCEATPTQTRLPGPSPQMALLRTNRRRLERLWRQHRDVEVRASLRDVRAAITALARSEAAARCSSQLYRADRQFRMGNSGPAWALLRQALGASPRRHCLHPLRRPDGSLAALPHHQADLLRSSWSTAFASDPPLPPDPLPDELSLNAEATKTFESIQPRLHLREPEPANDYTITVADVVWAIRRSRNTSAGPDLISNVMLKQATQPLYSHLARLFIFSVSSGYVPRRWLFSVVIPVPKPHKPPDEVSGYRPICLSSCVSKTLERILARDLTAIWADQGFIPETQFAFQPGKNATDAVLTLAHAGHVARMERREMVVAALDIQAAYDSVWLPGLLLCLKRSPVGASPLVAWVKSFLTDRTMSIRVSSHTTPPFPVRRGVPQGSPLSPQLYITFTAPMLRALGSSVVAYADDVTLYATGHTAAMAAAQIQAQLRLVERWGRAWRSSCNATKSTCMVVAHFHRRVHLVLQAATIPQTRDLTILGVTLSPRLGWLRHVSSRVRNATMAVNAFRRLARRPGPPRLKNRIYIAVVRPKLEYAAPAWAGAPPWLESYLQRTQNKCVRAILPSRTLNSAQRHRILHLPPINERLADLRRRYCLQPSSEVLELLMDGRYGQPRAARSPATHLARLLPIGPHFACRPLRRNSDHAAVAARWRHAGSLTRRRRRAAVPILFGPT